MPTPLSRKVVKREFVKMRKQTRRGSFLRLAGASSLLNAVTSENTRQAMHLQSMGDAGSVVNEKVKQRDRPLARTRAVTVGKPAAGDSKGSRAKR